MDKERGSEQESMQLEMEFEQNNKLYVQLKTMKYLTRKKEFHMGNISCKLS